MNNIKAALCAIVKLENHYIKEWVDYHLSLGFDKIFIYDNNDLDGESPNEILNTYDQVEIIDVRGRLARQEQCNLQAQCYNECYQKNGKNFNWIAFIDTDEFITLTSIANIKEFLADSRFNTYNCIYLPWVYYTDNDLVKVNTYTCLTRFTEPSKVSLEPVEFIGGKRIVRTNQPIQINTARGPKEWCVGNQKINAAIKECYSDGKPSTINGDVDRMAIHQQKENLSGLQYPVYIKHFNCKTIQEFLELKLVRQYPMEYKNFGQDLDLNDFFRTNSITHEKLDYIQAWIQKQPKTDKINQLQQQLNYYRLLLKGY